MELGLFTCGYQRYPLEKAFEDAARFGYDYIELWGGYPHAFTEDLKSRGTVEIERLIQRYGMPVRCFTPEHNGYPYNYMAGDEFQWERSMVYLAVSFTTGEPAAEYVRRLGNRFQYLHIIDNDGISGSHMLPGDGSLPMAGILQEIKAAGYDGSATIELVTGYLKEPSVYARMAADRVRAMLNEYG